MKYTQELLQECVRQASSVAQVLRLLGVKPVGGNHTYISNRIRHFGIDTSHFTGQGHQRGKQAHNRLSPDKILIKRTTGRRQEGWRLRRALIEIGRLYQCSTCGQSPEWRGEELRLQVDHINSDCLDDREDNLRFLCPNCHSQTDGWSGSQGKTTLTSRSDGIR